MNHWADHATSSSTAPSESVSLITRCGETDTETGPVGLICGARRIAFRFSWAAGLLGGVRFRSALAAVLLDSDINWYSVVPCRTSTATPPAACAGQTFPRAVSPVDLFTQFTRFYSVSGVVFFSSPPR